MNDIYANAYQEVIEVLKYTKREDLLKIPNFKIDLYKKYMNKNNNFRVDKNKSFEDQNISTEAKAILANLYKDYWANDYEKQRIEAKENYDLEQIAKEKYPTDNLFKKAELKNDEVKIIEEELKNTDTALIEYKESFFTRFKDFIFKILHITK